jgi:hypothetical protein
MELYVGLSNGILRYADALLVDQDASLITIGWDHNDEVKVERTEELNEYEKDLINSLHRSE